MPIVLTVIARIRRRNDAPNIGIYLIAISDGRYYVYAAKPSRIPIPGRYLRVCFRIGRSLGPLE